MYATFSWGKKSTFKEKLKVKTQKEKSGKLDCFCYENE